MTPHSLSRRIEVGRYRQGSDRPKGKFFFFLPIVEALIYESKPQPTTAHTFLDTSVQPCPLDPAGPKLEF